MNAAGMIFHGTSDGYLEAILRDGLRPESSGDGYLCWTDTLEVAEHHAFCMAEWDSSALNRECCPVVFAVPIDAFDPAGFCLEQRYISVGPSGGRACNREMTAHIKQRHQRDPWTWRELFEYAGAVGYARTLAVTRAMILAPPSEPGLAL